MIDSKFKVGDTVRVFLPNNSNHGYNNHKFIIHNFDGSYYFGKPNDHKAAGWSEDCLELVEKRKEEEKPSEKASEKNSANLSPSLVPPIPPLSPLPLDLRAFVYSLPTLQFQQLESMVRERLHAFLDVLRRKGSQDHALRHFATYMQDAEKFKIVYLLLRNRRESAGIALTTLGYNIENKNRVLEGLTSFLGTESEFPFCLCDTEQSNPTTDCPYYQENEHVKLTF